MAQVASAVAPAVVEEEHEEVSATELEISWQTFSKEVEDLITTQESFVKRLFGSATNYRTKLNLPSTAPGKREFRHIQTLLRQILAQGERQYKKSQPKVKRTNVSTTTGFNRLVILSAKLTAFMKLSDWGLVSPVDPTRGVCTHGTVTRYISNYVALNNLHNRGQKSTWRADQKIVDLFSEEWVTTKVDPNNIQYTDVQKLVTSHMASIKSGSAEQKAEEQYRVKIAETGEYGKAAAEVLRLRKRIEDLAEQVTKDNEYVHVCRTDRPGQPIGDRYLEKLKLSVAEFDKTAAELKAACKAGDFDSAPDFPFKPRTILSV